MLKCYCQKCGAPNEYISAKPNFCNSCGHKFGSFSVSTSKIASTSNKVITKNNNIHRPTNTDDDDIIYSHIDPDDESSFEYEPAEIENSNQVVRIADIARGKKISRSNNRRGTSVDNDTFIKNFKASAGPSKAPIEINEE